MNTIDVEYSNLDISRDLVKTSFVEGFNEYLDLIDSSDNVDSESEDSARYNRGGQLDKTTTYSLVRGFYLLNKKILTTNSRR